MKKGLSRKEIERRQNQSAEPTLYLDGKGETFRMKKKSKNSYKMY